MMQIDDGEVFRAMQAVAAMQPTLQTLVEQNRSRDLLCQAERDRIDNLAGRVGDLEADVAVAKTIAREAGGTVGKYVAHGVTAAIAAMLALVVSWFKARFGSR